VVPVTNPRGSVFFFAREEANNSIAIASFIASRIPEALISSFAFCTTSSFLSVFDELAEVGAVTF